MAARKRSLGERLMRWKALVANGRQFFEQEVPQAVPDVIELDSVAAEITHLHNEQVRLQGQIRHTTKRIRELSRRADTLRGRIGATLRGRFGYDSTRLSAFGFKPRSRKTPLIDAGPTAAAPAGEAAELPSEAPEGSEPAN